MDGTRDGAKLCGVVGSELELQEWVEQFFEDRGWRAEREVSPAESDYRADLIVSSDEYGQFGIETKYIEGSSGSLFASAHYQITQKYRGKTYHGTKTDAWVVCPYFVDMGGPTDDPKRNMQKAKSRFAQSFFVRHGIGYINLDRPQFLLDFNPADASEKVPVGGRFIENYEGHVDIESVHEKVAQRMAEYDYH